MTWHTTNPRTWMANCAVQAWSKDGLIHFNKRGDDNCWGAYSAPVDGSDLLTWKRLSGRHVGLGDVTADGRYALLTVERKHAISGTPWAEPGRGAWCDVVLTDQTTDWPLTSMTVDNRAVIWPCFSPDSSKAVWSQQYAGASPKPGKEIFGVWEMKIMTLSPGPIGEAQTVEPMPDSFYETYGWAGDRLLFASDAGRGGWWNTQIFTSDEDGNFLQMISDGALRTGYADTSQYAEFAKPLSDGSIAYSSGNGAGWGGMIHRVRPPDMSKSYVLTSPMKVPPKLATSFVISPDEKNLLASYAYDSQSSRVDAVIFDLTKD
jgi:hypothetical protein